MDTLVALPPRYLPKVATSSSPRPSCSGYMSTPIRPTVMRSNGVPEAVSAMAFNSFVEAVSLTVYLSCSIKLTRASERGVETLEVLFQTLQRLALGLGHRDADEEQSEPSHEGEEQEGPEPEGRDERGEGERDDGVRHPQHEHGEAHRDAAQAQRED